jgi:hypothetical protein
MLVLAEPGREIDGHYEQIQKYGMSVQPDVIVYQWFANDLELSTKSERPRVDRPWKSVLFNRRILQHSYFLFFVDNRLNQLLPGPSRSYEDYLLDTFAGDTAAWREFVMVFQDWAAASKRLTPRVLVVLYPSIQSPEGERLAVLHQKVSELCRESSVEVLDLNDSLGDYYGNAAAIRVGPYDGHPNSMVHERIARTIYQRITSVWPEVWENPSHLTKEPVGGPASPTLLGND